MSHELFFVSIGAKTKGSAQQLEWCDICWFCCTLFRTNNTNRTTALLEGQRKKLQWAHYSPMFRCRLQWTHCRNNYSGSSTIATNKTGWFKMKGPVVSVMEWLLWTVIIPSSHYKTKGRNNPIEQHSVHQKLIETTIKKLLRFSETNLTARTRGAKTGGEDEVNKTWRRRRGRPKLAAKTM